MAMALTSAKVNSGECRGAQRGPGRCCCSSGSLLDLAPWRAAQLEGVACKAAAFDAEGVLQGQQKWVIQVVSTLVDFLIWGSQD